jgi:hypothetical protein
MAVLGIDFDNTIACYDQAFHAVAAAQSLVPAWPPLTKREVKQAVCETHGENSWTQLQGLVYGPEIGRATLFPGFQAFALKAVSKGWTLAVVSHKTRHPVLGPAWDLHACAAQWLEDQCIFEAGLDRAKVFFETTRAAKLARVAALECRVFVDDLPEVFSEASFPEGVERWLFYPHELPGPWRRFEHWPTATAWLSEL